MEEWYQKGEYLNHSGKTVQGSKFDKIGNRKISILLRNTEEIGKESSMS